MFEDSLVESSGRLGRQNPWTAAASFTLQTALAGLVLLLSLFYTDALPIHTLISTLQAPPPPAQPAPASHLVKLASRPSEFSQGVLILPSKIPTSITRINDSGSPGEGDPHPAQVIVGGTGSGPLSALLNNVQRPTAAVALRPEAQKVRVSSGVAQGLLIRQVKPQYPPLARQARVQGTVVLQAVIGKDGTVQDLRVVSGHPLLIGAAVAAVKQWLYRPYYLNGEPVTVDTQMNVNFTLAGN